MTVAMIHDQLRITALHDEAMHPNRSLIGAGVRIYLSRWGHHRRPATRRDTLKVRLIHDRPELT
jgi:hypothetical protein